MIITFIGDIHGQGEYYLELTNQHPLTLQVGDFGVGFAGYTVPEKVEGNHWFIRGNHDDPAKCYKHPNFLGDFGYKKEWGELFYVSGADSIDKAFRVEGRDYWRMEELSYRTFYEQVIPLYSNTRPKIVMSHECPSEIATRILASGGLGSGKGRSLTSRALQRMMEIHSPDLWVFGHYHRKFETRYMGTKFVCIPTHEIYQHDTDWKIE